MGSRFVGTPRIGFSTSEHGRDYRVGYRVELLERRNLDFQIGGDAQHRMSPILGRTDNAVRGTVSVGW